MIFNLKRSFLSCVLCTVLLLQVAMPALAADTNDNPQPDPVATENPDNPGELQLPVWNDQMVTVTLFSKHAIVLTWQPAEGAVAYQVYRNDISSEPVATVEECTYKDSSISLGNQYDYNIVPVAANGSLGQAISATVNPHTIVKITKQKYSYHSLAEDCKELANLYPDRCRVTSIGTTVKGRKLYDVAIGNPKAPKSFMVICTLHAREYACSVLAMRQIEYYLLNYNQSLNGMKPADALNNLQIHYIVMANPDGVTISQTRHPRWKANSRGVDLNRNYPYHFKVSGRPGSEGFTGWKAGSERETKAIMRFTNKLRKKQKLQAVINYHAMGQIIFGDYNGKDNKVKSETKDLYWMARGLTGYKSAASYGGSGAGNLREYLLYNAKIPNITIEIGHTFCPVSYSEYNSIFQKNKLVVLKAAWYYKNK
ncbi:MAG: hypothetical protein E7277_02045 [Lachnospiraceae bacterium]|nr:hypothetical protein [Lachnospiraceae bacterium]